MAKSSLQSLFGRNRDTALLMQLWTVAIGASVWVEDAGGELLYGVREEEPLHQMSITVSGEVLGKVSGNKHTATIASMLHVLATQEDAKKKLGSEVLNLYREINLVFNFSEKLSSAVGKKSIAEMVLQEAGNFIHFQMGMVIFWEDHSNTSEVLTNIGNPSAFNELLQADKDLFQQITNPSRPEIVQSNELHGEPRMFMSAPLYVEHRVLGAIVLAGEKRQEFTAADLKLLNTLALQASTAIENAILYEKAAERTLELEREKLEKDNLQQLDELKSRFYTNITHEFRTPLTVILGMADLPSDPAPSIMEERLEMVRRNGAQMLNLVDQLLELTKLETQTLPVHRRNADIVLFVHQLLDPFRLYASEKGLSLEFISDVKQFYFDFDSDKLQQALVNLLSNAFKFTPAGGRISLSIACSGNALLLAVSDSGIGISADDMPLVFDRFFQANSHEPHSSGIGLAHARELVRLMDGDITVKSQPGSGSVFTISLPMAGPATGLPAHPASQSTFSLPESSEKPLLLLIEDHHDVAQYLQTCLQPMYDIAVAADGTTGIAIAQETVPDLIVSDVMMPGANGYEVCQTLKSDPRTSHVPIVLLTARVDEHSKMEGLRHGADACLGKPFVLEELLVHLEKLLELRKNLQTFYAQKALATSPSESVGEKNTGEDVFILTLKSAMATHLSDENFGLPELCRAMGMSRSQLFRKMKALIDEAPSKFIRMYRLHRAKYLLETTSLQVAEIAFAVGFSDPAYFSFAFHEAFGTTPSSVRMP